MSPSHSIDFEAFYKKQKSRARVITIVVASSTVICLTFIVFSLLLKIEADEARAVAVRYKELVDEVTRLAAQQQHESIQHASAMNDRIKLLEEQLAACNSK